MTRNEPAQCTGRSIAIPLIGVGAACCSTIDFVQSNWPDLAAVPGAAGSACALLGVLVLFRCQAATARARKAARADCIRISPYVPQMADGSSGAEILKIVLAPALQPIHARPAGRPQHPDAIAQTADAADVTPEAIPAATHPAPHVAAMARGESVTPFFEAHAKRRERSGGGATAAMIGAMRFGSEWARDVNLSGRALARLESDPFVKRLGRLA